MKYRAKNNPIKLKLKEYYYTYDLNYGASDSGDQKVRARASPAAVDRAIIQVRLNCCNKSGKLRLK